MSNSCSDSNDSEHLLDAYHVPDSDLSAVMCLTFSILAMPCMVEKITILTLQTRNQGTESLRIPSTVPAENRQSRIPAQTVPTKLQDGSSGNCFFTYLIMLHFRSRETIFLRTLGSAPLGLPLSWGLICQWTMACGGAAVYLSTEVRRWEAEPGFHPMLPILL